ncbi:hypothetical protein [Sorangium sp. So ce1000]|uniref:hypothetical protein n=1 Tax=Sorangium sp. So ce1000 TaxID=3133325 RepID=UPI003F616CD2
MTLSTSPHASAGTFTCSGPCALPWGSHRLWRFFEKPAAEGEPDAEATEDVDPGDDDGR